MVLIFAFWDISFKLSSNACIMPSFGMILAFLVDVIIDGVRYFSMKSMYTIL